MQLIKPDSGNSRNGTDLDENFLVKIVFFVLLVVLMISQNTQHMADRMFWFDEVSTYLVTINPFWDIPLFAAVTSGNMQPPIFYWMAWLASFVGTDPFTLRSVSVVCYIATIGFILFFVRELKVVSRVLLCLVLLTTSFAEFSTTEFRPYALSVFAILLSSVFLHRSLTAPSSWTQASAYGISALLLQYSLTLNCFVFGVQMLFVSARILISIRENGVPESLKIHRPILVISIFLSVQYLAFLLWVVSTQTYYISGSEAGFFDHVIRNSNTLVEALLIDSWTGYPILGLFIAGCLFGFLVNRWAIVYLLVIFAGQLYFSTYMTYASLPWFPQRYLVASYVAFGCICALGAEFLIQRIKNGVSIGITLFLLAGALYSGITSYLHSMDTPIVNRATAHIEKLHCEDRKTVIVSDPVFIGVVPWYAYRNHQTVIIPELSANIDELVLNAVNQNHCIILQEQTKIDYYSGNLLEQLSALPGYSGSHSEAGKRYKFLNSAWLFRPNAN